MEHQVEQPEEGRPAGRRYNVVRSCLRCHERKVRCSKTTPCSACLRAKVSCRYPGPERSKRRSRKQSMVNVVPRLERLERAVTAIPRKRSLEACNDSIFSARSVSVPASRSGVISATSEPAANGIVTPASTPTGGFLVKDGASTRYINEILFSSVLEKESELQSAIGTPESVSIGDNRASNFGFDGLISNPLLTTTDVSCLFPSRRQAAQLWQIFLNNVDTLLKLLHIPTMQPLVFAAINNPKQVTPDMSALLFSIYFAAVTSLNSPEADIILGQDRNSALKTYQRGLELSLHMASFLDSPTMITLQAMALYQMCHRSHSGGRSGWILNGLMIRAAQSIGLHRDGEHFSLCPLDCELRRRLWWLIIGSDTRVSEDHGLTTGGFDSSCDTKLPLNVDDRDLYADMRVAPTPKQRWTEITMFLVAAEMNKALQQVSRLSAAALDVDDKMIRLEQLLESVKESIEGKYLQYCDPNIPIQKSAILLGRVQMGKLEVFVRQQYLRGLNSSSSTENSAARASEKSLSLACSTMEIGLEMRTNDLLSNFHWLFASYPQYHLLTYILWHLCVRPDIPGADRAWKLVNTSFESAAERNTSASASASSSSSPPDLGPKWNVLRKLRDKAIEIRRHCRRQGLVSSDAAPAIPDTPTSPSTSTTVPQTDISRPPHAEEQENSFINTNNDNITPFEVGAGDAGPLLPFDSNLNFDFNLDLDLDSIYFPDWATTTNLSQAGGFFSFSS